MSKQSKKGTTAKKERRCSYTTRLNRLSAMQEASKLETQAAKLLLDLEDFHAVLQRDVVNMSDGIFELLAEAEFQSRLSLRYFKAIKRSLGSKAGCGLR